jgi:hypothetical protein
MEAQMRASAGIGEESIVVEVYAYVVPDISDKKNLIIFHKLVAIFIFSSVHGCCIMERYYCKKYYQVIF